MFPRARFNHTFGIACITLRLLSQAGQDHIGCIASHRQVILKIDASSERTETNRLQCSQIYAKPSLRSHKIEHVLHDFSSTKICNKITCIDAFVKATVHFKDFQIFRSFINIVIFLTIERLSLKVESINALF